MAADRAGRPPGGQPPGPRQPPGAATARTRVRWLIVVVAVMALLTAGWPLLNAAVSDQKPIAAGSTLRIGPSGADSAEFRVGPRWSLRVAESDPRQGYTLRSGAAVVSIAYVALVSTSRPPQLWAGLRRILRVSDPGGKLGKATIIRNVQGRTGQTAAITGRYTAGAATIFVGPSGTFAIEMIMLAPRSISAGVVARTRPFARSLRFPAAPR